MPDAALNISLMPVPLSYEYEVYSLVDVGAPHVMVLEHDLTEPNATMASPLFWAVILTEVPLAQLRVFACALPIPPTLSYITAVTSV